MRICRPSAIPSWHLCSISRSRIGCQHSAWIHRLDACGSGLSDGGSAAYLRAQPSGPALEKSSTPRKPQILLTSARGNYHHEQLRSISTQSRKRAIVPLRPSILGQPSYHPLSPQIPLSRRSAAIPLPAVASSPSRPTEPMGLLLLQRQRLAKVAPRRARMLSQHSPTRLLGASPRNGIFPLRSSAFLSVNLPTWYQSPCDSSLAYRTALPSRSGLHSSTL